MPTMAATFQSTENTVEMTTEVPFRLIRISSRMPKIIVSVTMPDATFECAKRYLTNSEIV